MRCGGDDTRPAMPNVLILLKDGAEHSCLKACRKVVVVCQNAPHPKPLASASQTFQEVTPHGMKPIAKAFLSPPPKPFLRNHQVTLHAKYSLRTTRTPTPCDQVTA